MNLPAEYLDTVFQADLPASGLPAAFVILTACDPMGEVTSDLQNSIADEILRDELISRGIPHFRVTGGSPDFLHQEPGWAAIMSFQEGLDLGRRLRQLGIWWVVDGVLNLVDCKDGSVVPLGAFIARLR
jgi:hypothetical protein